MAMAATSTPIGIPATGLKPDLTTSKPLFPVILATVLLCSILTTVFTAARLITKRIVSTYDIEDYILVAAWLASIAYNLLLLAAGLAGLGDHIWEVLEMHASEYPQLFKYSWALEILYTPAIWLAKASLLFQLMRIFTPMKSGPVYWACHTLIWTNLILYVSSFFTIVFECHPINEVWNPYYEGHCIDRNMVLIVTGACNVVSDLLNLLLPIWAIWHLQMAPKRKVGITAIFATGLLAFISSICRLVYAIRILRSPDISYIVAQVGLWAGAEITSIILCTCFPMIPRLGRLISDRYSQSKSHSSERTSKANLARNGEAKKIRGFTHDPGSCEDTARLKRPYKQLGEDERGPGEQASQIHVDTAVDIELATWDRSDVGGRRATMF